MGGGAPCFPFPIQGRGGGEREPRRETAGGRATVPVMAARRPGMAEQGEKSGALGSNLPQPINTAAAIDGGRTRIQ